MKSDSWLPLNSNDPSANAAIAVFLVMAAIILIVVGGIFLLPIVAIIGIAKGIHWYANRPTPTDQLYAQTQQRCIAANFPDCEKFVEAYLERFIDAIKDNLPPWDCYLAMANIADVLYRVENFDNPLPPFAPANSIEDGRYRDALIAHQKKSQDAPSTLDIFNEALSRAYNGFYESLPAVAKPTAEVFQQGEDVTAFATIPLLDLLPNTGEVVTRLMMPFFSEAPVDLGLFKELRTQLDQNFEAAGVVEPEKHKGSPREIVDAYLGATPLVRLFDARIPVNLPVEQRFAGHWIVAPPGRGKTTLLHKMVVDDLAKDDAALVLIDSKGDLIDPIKQLARVKDRLVLVEPNADNAIALNPLDTSRTTAEQAVSLIEYIMAGLLDAKFTALQSTLFRNVVPAIIEALPEPTLHTFKEVMVGGLPQQRLQRVNSHARAFFENRETGFHSKTYDSTRKEVVWRLDYLLTNPVLRSMFSASRTKLDLGQEMDAGKVIVINNSKAVLGDEGAEFFGRFFIALIARAAQQRSGNAASSKKPCFVYIDECQSVIAKDTRIPILLDECRSQKIALILSHQRTAQLSPPVLDAIANCAIRMANSDDEAKFLADKIRMDAATLRGLPRGAFGTYIRDLMPTGVQLTISKVALDTLPKMTPEDMQSVRERMRANFSTTAAAPATPAPDRQPAALSAVQPPPQATPAPVDDPGEPATQW
jgi:hypothetical protein